MRLLNTKTLDLEWFMDDVIPRYIILSHQWKGNEITTQDFIAARDSDERLWSPAVEKVMRFVNYAKAIDEQYLWIDTICIDKTSSAELQEAINSMYKWYAQAELCVAYLHDVVANEDKKHAEKNLSESRWFTRGWTLQEFLAARKLVFVDRDWSELGNREDLLDSLEQITGIERSYYGKQEAILQAPVAIRMSWASRRKTTRLEDMAYCMLGIFDINLTMMYGEGAKAFIRLQREIIREIDDDTIFIWTFDKEEDYRSNGVLAPHPRCFDICRQHMITKNHFFDRQPYQITTRGLEIEHCGPREHQFGDDLAVVLNCTYDGRQVTLPVQKISNINEGTSRSTNAWKRVRTSEVVACPESQLFKPLSAEEVYHQEAMRMHVKSSLQISNPLLGTSHDVGGFRMPPGRLGYNMENIIYKVYIL